MYTDSFAVSTQVKHLSQVHYLGHAGFCLETAEVVVVMDPWLSPCGAFDSAWFQFPRNHQLAPLVREKLASDGRSKFVYLSHEHKDHFDPEFLASLEGLDFTYVIPHFRRAALRDLVAELPSSGVVTVGNRETVPIPGGFLKLYLDDTELNRDSAILVHVEGGTFLNMNDCKLHDELEGIVRQDGPIDLLAAQFSGATWHPTCYDYSPERYAEISHKKMLSKFETVARAIQTIRPRAYVPSAGPPCFLDPTLLSINFEPVNIFPQSWCFTKWLDQRLPNCGTRWPVVSPGDVLELGSGEIVHTAGEAVTEQNYESAVRAYAADYAPYFERRRREVEGDPRAILGRLRETLEQKVCSLTLRERIAVPLYIHLTDLERPFLRVDFGGGRVDEVLDEPSGNHYRMRAPSWEIARVLDGRLTWEDFALTFRMRLDRQPDAYQTILQGFLILEAEDLDAFCEHVLDVETRCERILVEAGGKRYSVDRWCPHSGADLKGAWVEGQRYLVCPRHRWTFDLEKNGRCITTQADIHAVALEQD